MPESGWPRHGVTIGRQEFRRTLRSLRSDPTRLALVALGGVFLALLVLAGTWLVLTFVDQATSYRLSDAVRGAVTVQWVFLVYIFAQRAGSQHDRPDNESLLLLTVSVRSAVVGLLGAELLRTLAYLALPVLLLGGAFVYATVSPLMTPFLLLAVLLLLLTAITTGYAIGLATQLLVARVRFVARHKSVLGVGAVLVFFGGYFLTQSRAGSGLTATLGLFPLSWLLDVAVIGSPVVGSPARAAVAVGTSSVWILAWGLFLERLATALWFGDTVEHDVARAKATVDTGSAVDPLAEAVSPLVLPAVSQPTLRVAQRVVVIARRNPVRLSFLLFPVVVLGTGLINLARTRPILGFLPPLFAILVPWLAGGAFGLNPLGDAGPVLPATLTSLPSGRQFAAGLALPGLVCGVPLTVLGTAATGVYGPHGVAEVVLLTVLAAVLCLLAVTLAPAVGFSFPRFDPARVGSDREVVPPSLSAGVVYSLVLGVLGVVAAGFALAPAPTRDAFVVLVGLVAFPFSWLAGRGLDSLGGVATWLRQVGADIADLPTALVHWSGYGLTVVLALVLCVWSFRAVSRRYEDYTV